MSASAAVAYHDKIASGWDNRYQRGTFARRAAFFRNRILPTLPRRGIWLDVGCGSGYFSRLLARHGPPVIGYDGSQAMLESASRAAEAENLSARLDFRLVPTVERISRPDASVDGCLCLNVLEYLEKPSDCLDEMVRVLRPEGLLILSVPHTHSPVRAVQAIRNSMRGAHSQSGANYVALSTFTLTEPELRGQLEKRRMKVLMTSGFDGFIPDALLRVLPPSLLFAVAQKASQRSS
jgi:2-polyprenyl-6-hydroxyphenyl methylase/3-demethylubiquinone-9 3-methyltransferase